MTAQSLIAADAEQRLGRGIEVAHAAVRSDGDNGRGKTVEYRARSGRGGVQGTEFNGFAGLAREVWRTMKLVVWLSISFAPIGPTSRLDV